MLVVLDNYDSFTYNLVHLIARARQITNLDEIQVIRNDVMRVDEVLGLQPQAIIVSPGPETPQRAGILLELVERVKAMPSPLPFLGICLGHQGLAEGFGGKIVRADPVHGKTNQLSHNGKGLFHQIEAPFQIVRYHSLVVKPDSLSDEFVVDATSDEGHIMAIRHKQHPFFGLQFHPESIATHHGENLINNFFSYI